jgi:hypothetical protein
MSKHLREITSRLSLLSRSELRELKSIIEALLEAEIKEDKEFLSTRSKSKIKKSGGGGHIEKKKIKGYGPYLYLRYWSGGKLKSVYIGKPKG